MGNTADLVDVAQRLLARSRALLRHQQLLAAALEEMLVWMPVPPTAAVLNGPTMEAQVWQAVTRGVSGQGGDVAQNVVEHPAVLLQPGIPATWDAITRALPNTPPERILNFRRRLWRDPARRLCPASVRGDPGAMNLTQDEDLYLLQVDESEMVTVPEWAAPVPTVPRRQEVAGRRRQRLPRPEPCFWDGHAHAAMSGAASSSSLASSSVPCPPLCATGPTPEVPSTVTTDVALSDVVVGLEDTPVSNETEVVSARSAPARDRSRSRDV